MADPILAPARIYINGALAFAPGDVVPADHAKRLDLTAKSKATGPIFATADTTGITETADAPPAPGPLP